MMREGRERRDVRRGESGEDMMREGRRGGEIVGEGGVERT